MFANTRSLLIQRNYFTTGYCCPMVIKSGWKKRSKYSIVLHQRILDVPLVYFWPRADANEIGTSECYLIKVVETFGKRKKSYILKTPVDIISNLKLIQYSPCCASYEILFNSFNFARKVANYVMLDYSIFIFMTNSVRLLVTFSLGIRTNNKFAGTVVTIEADYTTSVDRRYYISQSYIAKR